MNSTINETVVLAGVPVGVYEMLLNLPDPLLRNRPEYSIQLANVELWEATTGFNKLLKDMNVVAATTKILTPVIVASTSAMSPDEQIPVRVG